MLNTLQTILRGYSRNTSKNSKKLQKNNKNIYFLVTNNNTRSILSSISRYASTCLSMFTKNRLSISGN